MTLHLSLRSFLWPSFFSMAYSPMTSVTVHNTIHKWHLLENLLLHTHIITHTHTHAHTRTHTLSSIHAHARTHTHTHAFQFFFLAVSKQWQCNILSVSTFPLPPVDRLIVSWQPINIGTLFGATVDRLIAVLWPIVLHAVPCILAIWATSFRRPAMRCMPQAFLAILLSKSCL